MKRGAGHDGAVGADDGLDAGHSVHGPERGGTVRGEHVVMDGRNTKREERSYLLAPLC